MKKTKIFDQLDNILGNWMEGTASAGDVILHAKKVNDYLIEHPHPHDIEIAQPFDPNNNQYTNHALSNSIYEMADKLSRQHLWYVELVARSKVIAKIGREPTNEELSKYGHRVITASGWEYMIYDGLELIGWKRNDPKINTNGVFVDSIDYVR